MHFQTVKATFERDNEGVEGTYQIVLPTLIRIVEQMAGVDTNVGRIEPVRSRYTKVEGGFLILSV